MNFFLIRYTTYNRFQSSMNLQNLVEKWNRANCTCKKGIDRNCPCHKIILEVRKNPQNFQKFARMTKDIQKTQRQPRQKQGMMKYTSKCQGGNFYVKMPSGEAFGMSDDEQVGMTDDEEVGMTDDEDCITEEEAVGMSDDEAVDT